MELDIKFRFLVFFGLLISFSSFSFAIYPQFEFSQNSYPSGDIDIIGKASSGTQVLLYINDNYISSKDILSSTKYVNISSSILDVNIGIGGKIIFQNLETTKTFRLNFSNGNNRLLSPGQSYEFYSYNIENLDYIITDINTNTQIRKKISITDELVNFNFSGVESKFKNGNNIIKFVLKSPLNTLANSQNFEFNVNYDKYSNIITIENYQQFINTRNTNIQGRVMDASSPLFYVLNIDDEINNLGLLNPIKVDDGNFNISINYLKEGNNSIRFISKKSIDSNYFNGEEKINIFVDTIAPNLEILSSLKLYTNEEKLGLNISTDATILDYIFNGQNKTLEIKDNLIYFELNLKVGQNNLTLIAKDEAGNEYRESHNINFNKEKPKLIRDEMKPEDLFNPPNEVHFMFQSIQGKTNKPNVEVTAFTFPRKTLDKNGNQLNCEMFENAVYRNLKNIDNSKKVDGTYQTDDIQLSLWSLVSKKVTFKTDSEGKFGGSFSNLQDSIILFFHEDTIDSSEIKDEHQLRSVKSDNVICFIMKDQFGNVATEKFDVKLDAGNTLWKLDEVTTIPNTLYASEIEQGESERRANNGNAGFSVIVKLSYIGDGKVTEFRPTIRVGSGKYSKFVKIGSQKPSYIFDKETNSATVVFQVEMKPQNIDPLDYEKNLEFFFETHITYSLDDQQIPIDTINPVHIPVKINIERPLDHTKWLTPNMIKKGQSFLNKSIQYTKKATEVMQKATIAGVLTCTAAKFYYTAQMGIAKNAMKIADGEDKKKAQKDYDEAQRKLFMICDRVVGLASPPKCDETNFDSAEGSGSGIIDVQNKKSLNSNELLEKGKIINKDIDGKTKLAQFESLNIGEKCDYKGVKDSGVLVTGKVTNYEEEGLFWKSTVESSRFVNQVCVPASFDNDKVKNINLNSIANVCYTVGAPRFDDTKCNFFGVDKEGVAGLDPSDNILFSIRCGVITDTYTHLKGLLKRQEDIYNCLEEAKGGTVSGTYCERLMSQAICDIATNAVLYFAKNTMANEKLKNEAQLDTRTSGKGDNNLIAALKGAKDGDKILNERYKGSFFTKAGLNTANIANKACVAAISGDISVLSDSVLGAIEQNEVEPTFGPLFAESRVNGYDPIKGMLNIQYRFSYNVYSGGQMINTKIIFICDSSQSNNEYCPDGYYESTNPQIRTDLRTYTQTVPKGGSRSDTITLYDKQSQYWFNKIRVEHTYTVDGTTKTKIQEFPIAHKGELFSSCSFSGGILGQGAGIVCDAIYTGDSTLSAYQLDQSRTSFIPTDTFYPGQDLKLNLGYRTIAGVDNNQQTSFDLVYKAVCRAYKGGEAIIVGIPESIDSINSEQLVGQVTAKIFKIPPIGEVNNEKSYLYKLDNPGGKNFDKKDYCLVLSTKESDTITIDANPIGFTFKDDNANKVITETEGVLITIKKDTNKISFTSKNKVTGVLLKEEKCDSTKIIGSFTPSEILVDSNKFDKLQEGPCQLSLMIVDKGDAFKIRTKEDFDNYKSSNSKFSSESERNVVNIGFNIKKTPQSPQSAFALTEISSGQILCLGSKSKIIPIKYSYSIFPEDSNRDNININIDAINMVITNDILTKTISQKDLNIGEKQIDINFDVPKFLENHKQKVETGTTQEKIEEHLFGFDPNNLIEMRLVYEIKKEDKIIKSETIDFNIKIDEKC